MKTRRVGITLLLLVLAMSIIMSVTAQEDDGQFCVRAFEDRNGNGVRDPGEPLLTRGIGAELLDERGAVIASAILDNSPTSAQGVICFQNLAPGQYSMEITSAEYEATISTNMTVTITGTGLPTVFEYGGQRIESAPVDNTPVEVDRDASLQRVLVSALGAFIAVVVMSVIGAIIYVFLMRRTAPRQGMIVPPDTRFQPPRRTTGSMPAVAPTDTGTMRAAHSDTGRFRPPPPPEENEI